MVNKTWDLRSILASILAFLGSLILLTVLTTQDKKAMTALGVLIALTTFLALPGRYKPGQCSRCGARPSKLQHEILNTSVEPISLATTKEYDVEYEQGWQVELEIKITCRRCNTIYIEKINEFISKKDASSKSEALIYSHAKLNLK